jgi:hypothetical protein
MILPRSWLKAVPLPAILFLLPAVLARRASAADLPVRQVTLYKHGVAFFERSGELKAGETARLDFKAGDMNDVLKSLTITGRGGAKISGVRYDSSEPLDRRLKDFPFALGQQTSLAAFLDQMKGSRLEMQIGGGTVAGVIVGARSVKPAQDSPAPERETVVLLTDAGDMRSFDLGAATSVKFTDPKLQSLFKDYLTVLSGARSKDRRSVYIDSSGAGARQLTATYMIPSAVWKSSYRLIFGTQGEPTLEGWAIVDNTSGEDWNNVKLAVVSGRPISFITQLYQPRYVQRPVVELAENNAVAPQVFQGTITGSLAAAAPAAEPQRDAVERAAKTGRLGGVAGGQPAQARQSVVAPSSISAIATGEDLGELFEYSFPNPVTVKQGESAMLPFLQQPIGARKLLIFSDTMELHPMNAAELTNTTGKTLDGGPVTVYENGAYAGEALFETLKAGDKRLIGYGVDLGTRISTVWDSSSAVVREIHLRRGILTTRSAIQETKTYTIKNIDAEPKTLVIEHTQRPGYKLLNRKPSETTANAYRFEVKLAASGSETFPLEEERVFDQTVAMSSATPEILATWIENKSLSDNARRQLEQIASKKREIASNQAALDQVQLDQRNLTQDQDRLRRNIQSLNAVAGQQEQVQQYARQLAASEARLAGLRDRDSQLRTQKTKLQSELADLIEKADF